MSDSGKRLIESAEQALYYAICQNDYPETFDTIQGLLGDSIYSKAQLDCACMEAAYIQDNNTMPSWASIIEQFEIVDGSYIFIYGEVR